MRFIQRLGTPCCPIPSKEHFTTLLILTEMLGDYSIDLKFFRSNNGLNWIEGQDSNEQTKAIVLANDEYLFLMNITANNIYSSPADPISNDLDIEEYLSLLKNYSSIEYYYPIETLSLVGLEVHTQAIGLTAIDMGLPSGVLWANASIDLTTASKFQEVNGEVSPFKYECSFFSWGNTEGHNPISESAFSYDWGTGINGPYVQTPGAQLTANAGLSFDAARAILGAPWRDPSTEDFAELFANIDFVQADGETVIDASQANKLVTVNGIVGIYLKSKINGKLLFFPCSGLGGGQSWYDRGSNGYYWSSSLYSQTSGKGLFFYSRGVYPQNNSGRFYGSALRPVQNTSV